MMYKVVRSSRLYEQIVQQVEESIQKGALKTGDELPPELAQQFGVSRTAVREAVKALREKGLVEAYPGRGTFIMETSSHPIRLSLDRMVKAGQAEGSRYLTEVREMMEPEIAALAAERADAEDLAANLPSQEHVGAHGLPHSGSNQFLSFVSATRSTQQEQHRDIGRCFMVDTRGVGDWNVPAGGGFQIDAYQPSGDTTLVNSITAAELKPLIK